MAYPAPFHRLVVIGSLYSDIFNFSLSIVPTGGTMPPVTQDLSDQIAANVGSWWSKGIGSGGVSIISKAVFKEIKLNRIGTNGKYMDPVAMGTVLPVPIAGSQGSNLAPQLTIATTLRGADERALGGRGRFYIPPSGTIAALGVDGRLDAGTIDLFLDGAVELVRKVNLGYSSSSVSGVVGIASKTRTGAFQPALKMSAGRVVDTMRSRRNKLAEDPEDITI